MGMRVGGEVTAEALAAAEATLLSGKAEYEGKAVQAAEAKAVTIAKALEAGAGSVGKVNAEVCGEERFFDEQYRLG